MKTFAELNQLFQQYLAKNTFQRAPQLLYDPINYIMGIGGKRLRPLLALRGCNLFDAAPEKALPIAMAVEIFHNFTLLHDDIMDNAPLRRGSPTVHVKFNANAAILSGDVMLMYAYQYLLNVENKSLIHDLMNLFTQMGIALCEGQQYDMDFETMPQVTIPEYLKMIEGKTAVLVAFAFQAGALVGGASKRTAAQLAEFGKNVGIAFQIQDDILDTYGDPTVFGKKVGGDIVQNKKTYLLLRALELADVEQRRQLERWMLALPEVIDENAKIETVKGIFTELGVRQDAEKIMQLYLEKAFQALDDIRELNFGKKEVMRDWATELMGRTV
jgi:geranylgeranyl diphosphate synthase, type II